MKKFTQLEKGTLVKNEKEYDYVIEVAEDFPKRKAGNVRLRIIEERPAIHKVRTRYDPEITMFGDKKASMDLVLGYDTKEMKKTFRHLVFSLISPVYLLLIVGSLVFVNKIVNTTIPQWIIWMLILVLAGSTFLLLKFYYKVNIMTLAEYLKAREIKKMLKKEGFKQ